MTGLVLISHPLCPYVQRAAIVLAEKGIPFTRRDIDLAAKPDWFLAVSPLGKTPVLMVGPTPVFESAAILEYLDETTAPRLHPADPLDRARHRGWIEMSSAILNDIAALYSARDAAALDLRAGQLSVKFARVEDAVSEGPWFAGPRFSMVDAVFAPVFRYFDILDGIRDFGILSGLAKTAGWRSRLSLRPSVRDAVAPDYPEKLGLFFRRRPSHLADLIAEQDSRGRLPA